MWWGCTHFLPVYVNSLLATLNVRQTIRDKGQSDLGISLPYIADTGASSKDNRRVCARHSRALPLLQLI